MKIPVLDHGYVEFVEAWGHGKAGAQIMAEDFEVGIVEAARQSTQGSFRGWEQDQKLLAHLYNNNHATPFEFAGMVIEVQAPIFVFREWHRHRTQSYNEMSARYVPLPDLYYEPEYCVVLRRAKDQTHNKQASGAAELKDDEDVGFWLEALTQTYDQCEKVYKVALEKGIPKELARIIMPVGHYSRMRVSCSLRNWLAFMTLRCDPKAQWEMQQFALAVGETIKAHFPRTYDLWLNH